MPDRTDIVYRYDGTYPGFLCCVAQCFTDKKLPHGVQLLDEPQGTLFPVMAVGTDQDLASRVDRSIKEKISPLAQDMVRRGFLCCAENKELMLIRFILKGFRHGPRVTKMSVDPDVHALDKALLYLKNEAHYHVEFMRFSDFGGFLASMITPNNTVLPLVAPHFCERFNTENLMIFDKTHGMGFLYRSQGRKREFFSADSIDLPEPSEEETHYRELWCRFYDTIAVEGRINPALRRGHMPMRYWGNMTEFQR